VDRASRCTEDFARLIRLSEEQDWRLIVSEMGIDTRTPMCKAMAHMAVVFAELGRDFIRMRTREALQVKKENGVTLGRPRSTPDDVVARVLRERTEGKTAYAIARDLNKDAPMRRSTPGFVSDEGSPRRGHLPAGATGNEGSGRPALSSAQLNHHQVRSPSHPA
jgi:DNA invertase Pin-like site-specific DNA recombinase